jgi:hypothetical protein
MAILERNRGKLHLRRGNVQEKSLLADFRWRFAGARLASKRGPVV